MEKLFFAWEILVNISEPLLLFIFLHKALRSSGLKRVFAIIGIFVLAGITTIMNLLELSSIPTLLLSLPFHIAYAVAFFNSKVWYRVVAGCSLIFISFISSSIVSAVVVLLPNVEIANIFQSTPIRFLLMLFYMSLNIILFALLMRFTKTERYLPMYVRIGIILLCLLGVIGVFLLIEQSFNLYIVTESTEISAIVSVIFLMLIMGVLFLFDRISAFAQNNHDMQLNIERMSMELTHNTEIINVMNIMRELRHDYSSHLQAISGYIEKGEFVKLEAYMKELDSEYGVAKNLISTGNIAFDAIISSKLLRCDDENIATHVAILLPSKIPLTDTAVASLFGNILDNAINACLKIDAEKRYIDLRVSQKAGMLSINVKNSSNGIYSFNEKNKLIRTDRRNNRNGLGISRIESIVNSCNGVHNIELGTDSFEIDILLPLKNEEAG